MTIETEVQAIMQKFEANGFEIYIVGGYVRDFLLQQTSHDIDLATNAHPEAIEVLFPKTLSLGKAFGTVTIVGEHQSYEVTTFRKDIGNVNHRKPKEVAYAKTLAIDVARRDLTINGLAMTRTGQIIDYVGGESDLAAKIIRTIGDPQQRFQEDGVRMLRAIRFAIRFGFTIEAQTWQALSTCAQYLTLIAKERQRKEWDLIVSSVNYDSNLIPSDLAKICFGAQWQRILAFPTQDGNQLQFWAFVQLVSEIDWKYQKKERALSQLVRERLTQPESIRYLNLSLAQACAMERVCFAWQQRTYNQHEVERQYNRQMITDIRKLAITGLDCQQMGIEKSQIKANLSNCIQAINENKIQNTKHACVAHIEEAIYGKENSININ
ncbi:MAG: CCA tRNA nucleotidyltransferase [Culicoidibacterales bacterium]